MVFESKQKHITLSLTFLLIYVAYSYQVKQQFNLQQSPTYTSDAANEKHSCNYAIQRWKNDESTDYQNIIRENQKFNDKGFVPVVQNMVYWNDRSFGHLEWKDWSQVQFTRLSEKYPHNPIIGNISYTDDTLDRIIADSYFQSAIYSISENKNLLQRIFITQEQNQAGLIALNVFVRGKPTIMILDDIMLMSNVLIFGKVGLDGSLSTSILQKAWAKINGNYERISYGSQFEVYRFFTGCPVQYYDIQKHNEDSIWRILEDADFKRYPMLATITEKKNSFGLTNTHSYAILGAYAIQDGNTTLRFIKMRNQWIKEGQNSSKSFYEQQEIYDLKYHLGIFDSMEKQGIFVLDLSDFLITFDQLDICNYHDDWQYSYYDRTNDKEPTRTYDFTLKYPQEMFISLDFYNPRMYSPGCKIYGETKGTITLWKDGQILDEAEGISDWIYMSIHKWRLEAGKYQISVDFQWAEVDEKDYTVSIYAKDKVKIYDEDGKENEIGRHDYKYELPQESRIKQNEETNRGGDHELRSELNKILANQRTKLQYKTDYWYYTYSGNLPTTFENSDFEYIFAIGDTSLSYNFNVDISVSGIDTRFDFNRGNDKCTRITDQNKIDHIKCSCEITPQQSQTECAIIVTGKGNVEHSFELLNWTFA